MEIISSESIILRAQDFQEQDRLVTFLSKDQGRLKGITKGSRKLTSRGVGNFEPLSRGIMHYIESRRSDLVTIRKCDPLPPYHFLQQNYHKFLFGGYLAELMDLCDIQPPEAEGYFTLLSQALNSLYESESPKVLPLVRLRFELKLLHLLGVQPDWTRCLRCDMPLVEGSPDGPVAPMEGAVRLDAANGGLICPRCMAGSPGGAHRFPAISGKSLIFLAAWQGGQGGDAARPSKAVLQELEHAVTHHLVHNLERQPKSLALLPTLSELADAR